MGLRRFHSSENVEWHVWSVVPGSRLEGERRDADRRHPEPILYYRGHERRSDIDRRRYDPVVRPGMERGWLTFESEMERRRMVPIPRGWEGLSDGELERLCLTADVIPKSRRLALQPVRERPA